MNFLETSFYSNLLLALDLSTYLAYLALLTLFIVYYTKAIKRPGIEQLKTFTTILLYAFCVLIALLTVVRARVVFTVLPLGVVRVFNIEDIFYLLLSSLAIYFIVAIILMPKEKATRHLMAFWLVIASCNLTEIAGNAWQYYTWKPPVISPNAHPIIKDILEHDRPDRYLSHMIYPFCWVIVSSISLLKISKEKRRSLSTETVS